MLSIGMLRIMLASPLQNFNRSCDPVQVDIVLLVAELIQPRLEDITADATCCILTIFPDGKTSGRLTYD